MTWQDCINGAFEALGGFAVLLSVRRLWRDKRVAGVHWGMIGFFASWGVWNLYYYPHLGQIASFLGGLGVASVNAAYLAMLLYYQRWPGGR